MVTPEEYATLPRSIQKKYFSPQERLRIAQQAAAEFRKKQRRKQTWLSATSTADLDLRPQSAHDSRSTSVSSSSACSAEIQEVDRPVRPEQATWYRALPEKVRRQHFSKEEQRVLTEECERVLQAPTDDVDVDGRFQLTPDLDFQATPDLDFQATPCGSPEPELDVHIRRDSYEADALSCSTCGTADTEVRIFDLYSRKRSSVIVHTTEVPPLPSDPPSPPPSPTPPPPPSAPSPQAARLRRRSFHRALALKPIALPPPTLAPIPASPNPTTPPPTTPVTPPTVVFKSRLSRPYTNLGLLPNYPPSASRSSGEAEVHELQCNSRRSSQQSDAGIELFLPSACSRYSNDDDDASVHSDGPSTPVAVSTHDYRTVAQAASFDSGVVLPMQLNVAEKGERSRSSSNFSNKSTTAHLAIPRPSPEPRISDEVLDSWQRMQASGVRVADVDALALEPLPFNDDSTGAHGAFATHHCANHKGISWMWKSIRRH